MVSVQNLQERTLDILKLLKQFFELTSSTNKDIIVKVGY